MQTRKSTLALTMLAVYRVSRGFAKLSITSGTGTVQTRQKQSRRQRLCSCGQGCGRHQETGPLASESPFCQPLLVSRSLSCPFVCRLWPSLGRSLESKYKKRRQSTFHLKSPRKQMWLLYRNGSNKGRKEYCFYSFWDIKHLENVIDWRGLIYHLSHSLCSLTLSSSPPHTERHSQANFFFPPFCFPLFFSLRDLGFPHSVKQENSCGYL